jgi:hypothetical protein
MPTAQSLAELNIESLLVDTQCRSMRVLCIGYAYDVRSMLD